MNLFKSQYKQMRVNYFRLYACIALLIITNSSAQYPDFDSYCSEYGKEYQNGTHEYQQRSSIYNQYVEYLRKNKPPGQGINVFSDWTEEEFQQILKLKSYPSQYITAGQRINLRKSLTAPRYLNWAERNVITSVKNQGKCGTCWSFATTAMIESNLILKGQANVDVDLSEQYLLQCTPFSTCDQGFLYYATETAIKNGLPYEEDLPYQMRVTGEEGVCERETKVKSSSNFEFFNGINEQMLKDLLEQGPVSISVTATSWKNYVGGIHTCINEVEPKNHAVLLVGYDDDSWIVKNQWGQGWGQNGYMRISKSAQNNCRVGEQVVQLFERYISCFLILAIIVILLI